MEWSQTEGYGKRYVQTLSAFFPDSFCQSHAGDLAKSFEEVQRQVAALFKDRIVVGHAVHNDFKVSTFPISSLDCVGDSSAFVGLAALTSKPSHSGHPNAGAKAQTRKIWQTCSPSSRRARIRRGNSGGRAFFGTPR